ncbi:MAG: hypothetical protein ACOCXA_00120 [Planctomycetota bacterium]
MRYAIQLPAEDLSWLCELLAPVLGAATTGVSDYMGGAFARFPMASIRTNRDPIAGRVYDERFPPGSLLLEFDQADKPTQELEAISTILRGQHLRFRFVDDASDD